jgi:hypothetical protein
MGVTCGAGTTYPSGAPDFNRQILVEFCVVMSVTISANKCSIRPDLQLFVGELVSYLRYLCLLSHSGAQRVLCFGFICLRFVLPMVPVSLDCPFLIAPSVYHAYNSNILI